MTRGLNFATVAIVPRKMRVQYAGAIYHVMSRGDRRELGTSKSANGKLHVWMKAQAQPVAESSIVSAESKEAVA